MSNVRDVMCNGGVLSRSLDGYEEREGQISLAVDIESTIQNDGRLIAEAPTGSGKSLACLIPAVLQQKKVVYATANIALQEQLYFKDLPFIRDHIMSDLTFSLYKGKSNYLCKQKMDEERNSLYGFDQRIDDWERMTETGDFAELDFVLDNKQQKRYSSSQGECLGKVCPFYENCYARIAASEASTSDVIVVNYHLLLSNAKVKMMTEGKVTLFDYDVLICDEAHKLPDIARSFFGWDLKYKGFTYLDQVCKRNNLNFGSRISSAMSSYSRFLSSMLKNETCVKFDHGVQLGIGDLFYSVKSSLSDLLKKAKTEAEKNKIRRDKAYVSGVIEKIDSLDSFDDDKVYFAKREGEHINCYARVVYPGKSLVENVFDIAKSCVFVSATLKSGGSFSFTEKELGVDCEKKVTIDSPFDPERALIVLSKDAPDPKAEGYLDKVLSAFCCISKTTKGGVLGLFTSYRALNYVAERLGDCLQGYKIYVQGDEPKTNLVKKFYDDKDSILLGTESFWAGVDVPGKACRCVIIDKIPFPPPGDPVLEELMSRVENGFFSVSIPRASIQLKQGVGRLIRRVDDYGVVVILDNRLATKGYGTRMANGLPKMRRSKTLKSISPFLKQFGG